jgi:hypothetical protein
MAQTTIVLLSSVTKIVSCYKNPADLVLFHDVEVKGHVRKGVSTGSWLGQDKALRTMMNAPGFSLVAILTLAPGGV